MKKFITLLFIFLFVHSFCLYADAAESFDDDPMDIGHKKSFGIGERLFEIGIMNSNINFANSFLSINEVLQDVVVIDIDKLSDGFKFNLGLNVSPFYFTFKSPKGWGFGLSTNAEAIGILGLSGKMLTLSQAVKDNSDIGGALFGSTTINAFFNIQKFKVSVNPSLFYTLAYITPSPKSESALLYTFDTSDDQTKMCIDYNIRLYTGFPMGGDNDDYGLTSKPGLDLSVGVQYQLAKELGISKILPFLDFDISLNLIHVPLFASSITDYTNIAGQFGSYDKPITFFNNADGDDFFSSFETSGNEPTYEKAEIKVSRPFKMILRADWRPLLGAKLLTISPVFGFSYNSLYSVPTDWEYGLNACLNIANFLLVKAGMNYTDRMYINSIGIALNLRAFEIDVGADIRSQTIAQSWTGGGLGINFGLKFGW